MVENVDLRLVLENLVALQMVLEVVLVVAWTTNSMSTITVGSVVEFVVGGRVGLVVEK